MNIKQFSFIHGLMLFVLTAMPISADLLFDNIGFNYVNLAGQQLMVISIIICLEIFIINISTLLGIRIGKIIKAIWSLSIIPLTIFVIADFKLVLALGTHFTLNMIYYSLNQSTELIPLISSELNWIVILSLITATSLSIGLIKSSSQIKASKTYLNYTLTFSSGLFLIFAFSISDNCPNSSQFTPIFSPGCNYARAKEVSNKKIPKNILSSLSYLNNAQNEPTTITPPPQQLKKTSNSDLKNIVIVALESFRTDAVTPYTPKLKTTPFLNKMAKEGLLVETAYTNFPHTSKSLIAINCGMPPYPSMRIIEKEKTGLPFNCLPKLLKPIGYNNAFFSSATGTFEGRTQLVKNMGYDKFVPKQELDATDWETVNYFGLEDKAMISPIFDWVDDQKDPFLLSIMTVSSHHSYNPPKSFGTKTFAEKGTWNDYLNTVYYTDTFLEELFNEFEERDLLDNTLFIFTGDHGVGIGQFNTDSPVEKNIQIPLILWNKDLIPKAKTITEPRQHSDIIPTIADMLKLEPVDGEFFGLSLLEDIKNRTLHITCKRKPCQVILNKDLTYVYNTDSKNSTLFASAKDPLHENNIIENISNAIAKPTNHKIEEWRTNLFDYYKRDH